MRENSATVLSAVPLPAGADDRGTWDYWDHDFRVVYTPETAVGPCTVVGTAIQWLDGSISVTQPNTPQVIVQGAGDGLTTVQARELAAAITAAADLIDGWVTR